MPEELTKKQIMQRFGWKSPNSFWRMVRRGKIKRVTERTPKYIIVEE